MEKIPQSFPSQLYGYSFIFLLKEKLDFLAKTSQKITVESVFSAFKEEYSLELNRHQAISFKSRIRKGLRLFVSTEHLAITMEPTGKNAPRYVYNLLKKNTLKC